VSVPDKSSTVGDPLPRHSTYIERPPPMSTRLAKFLLGWSAAAVAPTETKLETTITAAPNNVA
jgi:hypothetical protein